MEALEMANIIVFVFIAANAISCGRLLSYQRGSDPFKYHLSCLAYVLIVCTGGQSISAMLEPTSVSLWASILSVVLCVLLVRGKGNVASLVRAI
jgi:hypothetical protein